MSMSIKTLVKKWNQYMDERDDFENLNGLIAPIRAVVFKHNSCLSIRTTDTKTIQFLLKMLSSKREDYISSARPIGYFAACVRNGVPILAYSLCAWQDIKNFDKDIGIALAVHRSLNNPQGEVKGSVFSMFENKKYSRYFWSESLIDKDIMEHGEEPNILFIDSIVEQAHDFIARCKKYYKDKDESWIPESYSSNHLQSK